MKKEIVQTKVMPWGNSFGLRLPRSFVAEHEAYFKGSLEVSWDVQGKMLVLRQLSPVRTKGSIVEQMERMKPVKGEEVDWGVVVGKEVW